MSFLSIKSFCVSSPMQTGDKSGESTARMNLSDLRLVVGLKSNSQSNIFRSANSSLLAGKSLAMPVKNKGQDADFL